MIETVADEHFQHVYEDKTKNNEEKTLIIDI